MTKNNTSKGKMVAINSFFALLQQFVSVISGFILPRIILSYYGSSYNGLISSISQFLSCIILLNGGVGGVTRAALYSALAAKEEKKVSSIINATEKYLHKICFIFLGITFLIAVLFPFSVVEEFPDWKYIFSLVLVLAISTFAQYFFALAYQTLLIADQKQYIKSIIQIVAIISSTLLSVILIINNVEIRLVKLIAALCFVAAALYTRFFTINKYKLDSEVEPDNGAIKQRWDAFAHTIANFIHGNTDIIILTFFTNTLELSVYSVYYLVFNGMKQCFDPIGTSIESYLGNTLNQDTQSVLYSRFKCVENIIFSCATLIFTSCAILVVCFVDIYTKGITDINYSRYVFSIIACAAELLYCLRIPYQMMVQAAGKFKETRNAAICEAGINITVSLLLVPKFGLIGVSIGTLVAMAFRTTQFAYYTYKNIIVGGFSQYLLKIMISFAFFSVFTVAGRYMISLFSINTWSSWIIVATIVVAICFICGLFFLMLIDRKNMLDIVKKVKNVITKGKVKGK